MSDAQHGRPAARPMTDERSPPDVLERFAAELGARRSARVAIALLALLFAGAIFAPLLANDRPYVLQSIDRRAYADAQRSLVPIVEALGALAAQSREEYDRQRGAGVHQTQIEAIAGEALAAERSLSVLRRHLLPEDTALLDACAASIRAAVGAKRAGRDAESREESSRALGIAREIQRELAPVDRAHPERGGKVLHSVTSHPLLESLTAIDVFLMALWAIASTAPLWNRAVDRLLLAGDPERIRRARVPKLCAVCLVPLLLSFLPIGLGGGNATFAGAPFKSDIARGDVLVERAVFPPIAMGFAETNLAEANRPPTWLASAEISPEGYYVRGPRAPVADPSTGHVPPPNPVEVKIGELERNAALRHPLGTDSLGRDLLARLLWGGRTSLSVGLLAALLLTAIGTLVGAVAGYAGGAIDRIASRGIEIVLCVPAFFLILSVMAFTDPDVFPPVLAIVLVIACVGWTGIARLVRAEFLRLRELEFVLAARSMGFSPARIVTRHMLPNALGPVLVASAFAIASSTLYESALSYLGLGVGHPIPSWGALINDSHSPDQWWTQVFPGLCLFATVLAYNLLGEGIRDALDPRSPVSQVASPMDSSGTSPALSPAADRSGAP